MAVVDQTKEKFQEIPVEEEDLQKAGEKVYVAPPWKLMWWRFRKHKMALISTGILMVLYFVAVFCEFVSPYDPNQAALKFKQVPPTKVHVRDAQGQFQRPFVYQHERTVDPETLQI